MLLMVIIFSICKNIDKLAFSLNLCFSITETFKQAQCLSYKIHELKMYFINAH